MLQMPQHLYPFCTELRKINRGSVHFVSNTLVMNNLLFFMSWVWEKEQVWVTTGFMLSPNNSVDAVSCSLQCRRLAGRRGDRKENSTIFYPFPLVLSTFPPVTLVFTLDIPSILFSLKKSKMASADKLNDHSPEKLCVYHRLPKLRRNSWYTRLSSSKT